MNDLVPSQGGSEGARVSAPQPSPAATADALQLRLSESLTASEAVPSLAQLVTADAALGALEGIQDARVVPPAETSSTPATTARGEPTTAEPPRHITIAFDGGCFGNPGPGGYGAILVNDRTGAEKIVKGRETTTTNNQMELSAAIAGLNALRPGAVVHMLGDSLYVIKGITEWLPGWKLRGWRGAAGKPVANAELWQALEVAVQRHQSVTWQWVKGHAGHVLNERVDAIANGEAMKSARIVRHGANSI